MPFQQAEHEGKPGWVCNVCKTFYITGKDLTHRVCPCQVDPTMREIVLGMLTGTRTNVINAYNRYKNLPEVHVIVANYARAKNEWTTNGSRWATFVESQQRLEICGSCPSDLQLIDQHGHLRCTHTTCGCYLAPKSKMKIKAGVSDCPREHWPVIG